MTAFISRVKLATQILLSTTPSLARSHVIRAITPEEVVEAKSFFPMGKFFIFGHARSGTTLLTRLIRLHPEVHCNYQAHFFTRPPLLQSLVSSEEVGDWLKRPSNRWNRGIDLSPVVLRAVADYILERDAQKEGASIVGDKSPNSLLDGDAVKLMHQVYPDARLIYIIRDGRDAAISHRFQTFIDRLENLNAEDLRIRADFAQDPEPFLRAERSIFTSKALRQAAEGWVQNVEQTDRMGKDLYGPHYISLRYEDMLTATWDEMSRLWAFLDADLDIPGLKDAIQDELSRNPDADWQRQKDSQIGEAIEKGKKGNWRQMFTSEDRAIFQKIAGETLKTWHYSV